MEVILRTTPKPDQDRLVDLDEWKFGDGKLKFVWENDSGWDCWDAATFFSCVS